MEVEDQVTSLIGNIGRWQWAIILPLAFREIFTSWQMLSPPFLAMEPQNFYCNEPGMENFANLTAWQEFANPKNPTNNISFDTCNVFDIDFNANQNKVLNESTRPCTSWIFPDNHQTLVTEVNINGYIFRLNSEGCFSPCKVSVGMSSKLVHHSGSSCVHVWCHVWSFHLWICF